MRRISVVLLMLLVCSSVSQAQDKPAEKSKAETPVVSVEDGLKLANYILTSENLAMKVKLMQDELEKNRTAFNAMLQSMQKPGFHLERDAQSQNFVYVADPPKPVEKPTEKPEKK